LPDVRGGETPALLRQAPALTLSNAGEIARALYGVVAEASSLPSERDQNFLLRTAAGPCFVLKIANGADSQALLEAQNAALAHVGGTTDLCPRVLSALDGRMLSTIAAPPSSEPHFVRLLTWLPGVTLGSVTRRSPTLLRNVGRAIARLDVALAGFDHPAIHRDFYWDLTAAPGVARENATLIADAALRGTVEHLTDRVEQQDHSKLQALPRCAVHNDPNDYNVLVAAPDRTKTAVVERVTGVVDFGDLVHSFSSSDLAIAIAYAILGSRDPLGDAAVLARGYNEVRPLSDIEIDTLFPLILLRLCASVAIAASQTAARPNDPYLAVSQAPIKNTLPRLAGIHPMLAATTFRIACGRPETAATTRVLAWLEQRPATPTPILDCDISSATVIDLSVGSPLVAGDPTQNEEAGLTARINAHLADRGAEVGLGRYREARLLYSSPLFASIDDESGEGRTVHLGIDLFAGAGTGVRAALDGVVHGLADNRQPFDYGPVVILRHLTDSDQAFYTLYGHLSRRSLEKLTVGQSVTAGTAFATLGSPHENGGWTPHLHFQLIVDLLDRDCDFPGVCRPREEDVWCALSPDPNAILRLPVSPAVRKTAAILTARQRSIGRNLSIAYHDPIEVGRGWMQYLFDVSGRRYLDAYNNVPHVGHAHPRVVQAAAEQMQILNTNTRYLHAGLSRYAERLTATLPEPLRVCFFVNSGSEANELALRLARAYTGRRGVVVLEGAYHGNTSTLVEISPYKFNGPGGTGAPEWVRTAPVPDVYRDPIQDDVGARCAAMVARAVGELSASRYGISAFIAESAPSVAGQIVLPPGYLQAVYHTVRAAGGVCIADEVQTAYGRMGSSFYAFEDQSVVPDVVVLGKPIGNGHPIGAVVTTPAVAASFDNGMEFFSTFGGNTVSCAVGLEVLDIVIGNELQRHAREVGATVISGLKALADRHALIGDVRGSGLFLGVELVTDRKTLDPASVESAYAVDRLREEGVLLGTEGPFGNVLKIRPPMPFTSDDGERLCRTLDRVLGELA
jgi:4-aminobutyrate aminotransferase-like enzyme/Ser/Thr protein kinase RdoA (MazF antagonist)